MRLIPGAFIVAGLYTFTCAGLIMLFQGPSGYATAMAIVLIGAVLVGVGYIAHTANDSGGPGVTP